MSDTKSSTPMPRTSAGAASVATKTPTTWTSSKSRLAEGALRGRPKVQSAPLTGIRDIGMIEYAPGNHAWRPVEAEGYLVIHCLMVNGKHKGKGLGTLLLDSCLRDAKKSNCRGVAVVTSSDSLMAGSDFFLKAGFVSVEKSPPTNCSSRNSRKHPRSSFHRR